LQQSHAAVKTPLFAQTALKPPGAQHHWTIS
jgi:hypothetical protein